jgi:hypothetical protein
MPAAMDAEIRTMASDVQRYTSMTNNDAAK